MLTLILIFLAALSSIHGDNRNCRNDWNNQKQCMDRNRPQFTNAQISDQDRNDMKRKMSQCYLDERCSDPFPSDREDQARTKCFQEAKDHYQREMQDCVRKNFPDYDMPNAGNGNRQWGQDIIRMKSAKCQAQDKKRFGSCMQNAMQKVRGNNGGNNGGNNHQQKQQKPDPCELRYQCYEKNMAQPCYDRQNDVKKELCNCASRLNIGSYQSAYQGCMKNAGFNVDTNNDFNYASFGKIKDKFCKQTQDPCGGYNGRQALGRNNQNGNGNRGGNNNNGNPPQSSNNGGQWRNDGGQWRNNGGSNGGNGGSNGNNGFNGGNNGFNGGNNGFNGGSNGQNNGNSGSDGNFGTGNYDFSSVGGDDDGFPSVGNVLSNGNSATSSNTGVGGAPDLSSFISSSNTGFDPSSFLGGATGGTGATGGLGSIVPNSGTGGGLFSSFGGGSNILSSFTGGGLGGLGGAGGTGGTGGIFDSFDPSSIFSGLTGGKKK